MAAQSVYHIWASPAGLSACAALFSFLRTEGLLLRPLHSQNAVFPRPASPGKDLLMQIEVVFRNLTPSDPLKNYAVKRFQKIERMVGDQGAVIFESFSASSQRFLPNASEKDVGTYCSSYTF